MTNIHEPENGLFPDSKSASTWSLDFLPLKTESKSSIYDILLGQPHLTKTPGMKFQRCVETSAVIVSRGYFIIVLCLIF